MEKIQKLLAQDQLEAFYHDNFVKSQVADFISLTSSFINPSSDVIVDIGGGVRAIASKFLCFENQLLINNAFFMMYI